MTDLLPDIVAAAAREPEPESQAKAGVHAPNCNSLAIVVVHAPNVYCVMHCFQNPGDKGAACLSISRCVIVGIVQYLVCVLLRLKLSWKVLVTCKLLLERHRPLLTRWRHHTHSFNREWHQRHEHPIAGKARWYWCAACMDHTAWHDRAHITCNPSTLHCHHQHERLRQQAKLTSAWGMAWLCCMDHIALHVEQAILHLSMAASLIPHLVLSCVSYSGKCFGEGAEGRDPNANRLPPLQCQQGRAYGGQTPRQVPLLHGEGLGWFHRPQVQCQARGLDMHRLQPA